MPNITANEEARLFAVDGVRYYTVSDILQGMGFIDTTWMTQKGAENGTRRHTVCELDDKDDLLSCDPVDLPYLVASQNGKMETGIEILSIEQRRYNHPYRYCGKPDLTVIFQGHKEVWDRKTGARGKWHRFQIGGYLGLYDDIFFGRCIYLQGNGLYRLGERYGRKEREDFLTINRTFQLREEM